MNVEVVSPPLRLVPLDTAALRAVVLNGGSRVRLQSLHKTGQVQDKNRAIMSVGEFVDGR